ncbi:hypothetical protein M0L20_12750 [Spirosoma sp. RP8]|uniref:Uncharacterized protein n=1 Tax=Spirosoma liriopis TaxID=2937440 RepID=A0ABT0HKN8_9BACT|nr:hypothetical protein [Spirosoma liriopis]MCK8492729.1 hypothetical protein [Spirosoma liriopis]
MAHHDQKIDTILDDTLATLGGGASSTTPDAGVDLIQEWIFIVRSNVSTQWVAEPLEKLRDAINTGTVREVERILYDLSGETVDLANNAAEGDYKVRLQNLSTALKDFAHGLAK